LSEAADAIGAGRLYRDSGGADSMISRDKTKRTPVANAVVRDRLRKPTNEKIDVTQKAPQESGCLRVTTYC